MIRENGETHISNKYLDKKQRSHQSGGEKLQELLIMGRRCARLQLLFIASQTFTRDIYLLWISICLTLAVIM